MHDEVVPSALSRIDCGSVRNAGRPVASDLNSSKTGLPLLSAFGICLPGIWAINVSLGFVIQPLI